MSKRSEYLPTKTYADLTTGQALRIMRELQGMTQVELARVSGVTQAAISALERDRETLGIERAKTLASALRIHPAVLVFTDLAPSTEAPLRPSKGSAREDDDADAEVEPEASSVRPKRPQRSTRRRAPARKSA